MPKTLTQTVTFKNIQVKDLYSMFLDSRQHAKLTGGNAARISPKAGTRFSAHNGYCFGQNLQLVKDKLIVQSWRAADWKAEDLDSTFILSFYQNGKDAVLDMIHANVPDDQAKGVKSGWNDFYWKPWKSYLKTR